MVFKVFELNVTFYSTVFAAPNVDLHVFPLFFVWFYMGFGHGIPSKNPGALRASECMKTQGFIRVQAQRQYGI